MLREVIQSNNLTSDDILFRMHARVWDGPMDYPRFCECLRKLDPSLGDSQLRVLAKTLRNKDGKIEVPNLLVNLCGKEFETVDYRNKIFRTIYSQVYPRHEKKLLKLLEEADPLNDGRVEPAALKVALLKVTKDIDQETLDRFVRFLDKDTQGKVDYIGFFERMSEVSNRDHNPFKSVVQRLSYFIQSNSQTVQSLIKRLTAKNGLSYERGVPVEYFADFLQAKIDKKRSEGELRKYASYIDIDKDGYISEIDLQTCMSNLGSDAFFRDGGDALAVSAFSSQKKFFPVSEQLSAERAFEIAKQIKAGLIAQKIAPKEAFNRFDANKDGFLSFSEFSTGLDNVMQLSLPVKEKFFALMDKNQIGLVDYPNFLSIIQATAANNILKTGLVDSFDWENNVID
jgi:Ca2+-binding EF-hand superfamily protein